MKTMNIGGAERSLIGLLNSFDYDSYDVSLFLNHHVGELMNEIPKEVNLLPENTKYSVFEIPISKLLFSRRFIYGIARLLAKIDLEIYCILKNKDKNTWIKQQYAHKYIVPLLPKIEGEFEIGINFLGVSDILNNKIKSNIKIGWIHTDYDQLIANKKMDYDIYSKLDYIINVSNKAKDIFLREYPYLTNKTLLIENIVQPNRIKYKASEFLVENEMLRKEGGKVILSIGRFGKAKNFDSIPEIASIVNKKHKNLTWYIIGYGSDENLIEENIIKFNMQNNVFILGKKTNPYPYIAKCDVYIQPSRYEAKAVTVREAQILGKPVIITNYQTARDQLNDGIDGFIVSQNIEKCGKEISLLLEDDGKLSKVSEFCKNKNFDNKLEIEKLYNITSKL